MTLSTPAIAPGNSYKIIKLGDNLNVSYRHRLLSMGMLPGATFRVIRAAPFGKTLHIELAGAAWCLRASELDALHLERVE